MYFKYKEKIFFLYWLYRRNVGICNPIFKLYIFIWIDNKGADINNGSFNTTKGRKQMDKNSFLIYIDYEEQFSLLTDEQLGQLIRAIMKYEKTSEIPKLDGMLKMAFSFIKTQLDRDREKYEEKCAKNRENAKRGGRPKKQTDNKKPDGFKENQMDAKKPDNDNDDEDDNDNEEDEDNNNNDVVSDSCVDGLQGVIDFYNNNIGFLSPYGLKILESYAEDLSSELVIYAMQISVENNKKTISYIKAILNNWTKANIKTLEEAKRENKKKVNTDKQIEQRNYTEDEFESLYAN